MSLDPSNNPSKRGRGRFTIAHEYGHWMLHRDSLLATAHPTLFNLPNSAFAVKVTEPAYKKNSREPREIQADKFAAALLMPRSLLHDAWVELFGPNAGPINVWKELEAQRQNPTSKALQYGPRCNIAIDLSHQFEVSSEAMQFRLSELGYIKTEPDNQLYLAL